MSGVPISSLLLLCCTFLIAGCQGLPRTKDISGRFEKAIVKSDQLIVYSEASPASTVVGTLKRGELVTILIEYPGPDGDGPWCGIDLSGKGRASGFVQCSYLAMGQEIRQEWQLLAVPPSDPAIDITEAIIRGNQVIVPVILSNGRIKEEVRLLFDTGASSTAISSEVASRLHFDLDKAEKTLARVADGSFVDTRIVHLDALQVGPHVRNNMKIAIIDRKVSVEEHDGMLGMDFLRDMHFRIDFQNRRIIWQ